MKPSKAKKVKGRRNLDDSKLDELIHMTGRMEDRLMRIEGSIAQLLEGEVKVDVKEEKGWFCLRNSYHCLKRNVRKIVDFE